MRHEQSLVLASFAEAGTLAKTLSRCSLLPAALRGKEPDVLATILAGRELGMGPMASLRSIHVIDGKPCLGADAMVGVAQASGFCEYFICLDSSATKATYETKRKGAPRPTRLSFTIEEARAAGLLSKDNWKRYPAAMLRSRAKAALARDVYQDALAGIYTDDELGAHAAPTGAVIDAEVVANDERPTEPTVEPDGELVAELEVSIQIAQGKGLGALEELAERLKDLPEGAARERLKRVYRAAWKAVSAQQERARAKRTAASDVEHTSQSNPSDDHDSGRGSREDGPTSQTTSHPSEAWHSDELPNMDDGSWYEGPAGSGGADGRAR